MRWDRSTVCARFFRLKKLRALRITRSLCYSYCRILPFLYVRFSVPNTRRPVPGDRLIGGLETGSRTNSWHAF